MKRISVISVKVTKKYKQSVNRAWNGEWHNHEQTNDNYYFKAKLIHNVMSRALLTLLKTFFHVGLVLGVEEVKATFS